MPFGLSRAASFSGGGTISGNLTINGDLTVNGDGSGNYDEIVNGNMTISSTNKLVLGGDGSDTYLQESGADVLDIYVGGANMMKFTESSTDTVAITGSFTVSGDAEVDGTSNLDNTDIDGTLVVDGSNISLDSTSTLNIDNSNTSNGITIGTATSGVPISIGHSTSETTVNDNLVVTGDIDLEGSIDVNGTANLDVVDIDGAVDMASTLTVAGIIDVAEYLKHTGDTDTHIRFSANDAIEITAGNVKMMRFLEDDSQDMVVINEDSADIDFRVESNNNANMFFVDGGNDRVGIGTASPSTLMHLAKTGSTGDWAFTLDNNYSSSSDVQIQMGYANSSNRNSGISVAMDDTTSTEYLLYLASGGTERFRITGDGNVSIGASSPSNVLHIEADSGDEGLTVHSAGDTANAVILDANRSGAGSALGNFVGKWNGTTVGYMGFFSGADTTNKDDATIRFATASAGSATERMRITSAGDVKIGTTNYDNGRFEVYEDADDQLVFLVNVTNSLSNELLYLKQTLDTSESSFNFLMCVDHDQARMKVRGDGELYADGSSYNSGADYAEYFETKDGKAIDSGITVKLDGDKIVPCEDGDTPIGVIRPEGSSMTIGNTAWAKWEKKYLSDDYGKPIFEECTWTIWYENVDGEEEPKKHAYESDRIPSDVTKPDDAIVETHRNDGKKHFRRKLNPDYDSSKSYESRTERDEWQIVGLLGQIPVKKGQPIGNWIKMKDVSDTVEMYFVK